MSGVWSRLFVFGMVSLWANGALAHKPSDSYLKIVGGKEQIALQWEIALKDLEYVIGLDVDQNGEITWGELKAQRTAVAAHALSRLELLADGRQSHLQVNDLQVARHSDGAYAVLVVATDAPGNATQLELRYNLLFDVDPTHRGLVVFENDTIATTRILSPEAPTLVLKTGEARLLHSLQEYVREGVHHIWQGYDHLLFLLSLLLPAVLMRQENAWHPVDSLRPTLISVLKIVTVFTVAHSITLWLAVMQYVTLPGQLVEATIALSILITAVLNLFPVVSVSGWKIAFCFGLVHGFGFANVLLDLGLSSKTMAIALLGFNVGVEMGQIAIVLLFLPIAWLLRKTAFYRWGVLQAGSILIAMMAMVWMVERLFPLKLIDG